MKKSIYIFTIIILCFVSAISKSQHFSLYPGHTFTKDLNFGEEGYDGIYIKNNTAVDLDLAWTRISVDTITGCVFYPCVNALCLNEILPGGDFPGPIAPGDSGFYRFHMYPGNISGTNTIKLLLYDRNDPAFFDTLTFIINVLGTTGIGKQGYERNSCMYPNPAEDFIYINTKDLNAASQDDMFSIYNLMGEKVKEIKLAAIETNKIDISGFPAGMYLMQLKDKQNLPFILRFYKVNSR